MRSENFTRIAVDVTFLRLEPGSLAAPSDLPPDVGIERPAIPSVAFYRYLYDTVGGPYCWWLRRVSSDAEIGALMRDPAISLHVAMREGEPAGFFELDARSGTDVNIGYFGLLPHAIGTGLGYALLIEAVKAAREASPSGIVRVNTCTADHPRAMPTYLRAGFRPLRTVREFWDIPTRLGMIIPDRLKL